jgi:large subunit ribosomal protein L7/L12
MAEETKSVELSDKLQKIATEIEKLTVLELSELASYLEEKFGVSAMPMMAGPMVGGAAAADAAPAEEKTAFNVVLTDGGANKLAVIKAVREIRQDLGLMDAKKLVETPPQTLLENAKKEDADAAKAKLEEAGAKVELK